MAVCRWQPPTSSLTCFRRNRPAGNAGRCQDSRRHLDVAGSRHRGIRSAVGSGCRYCPRTRSYSVHRPERGRPLGWSGCVPVPPLPVPVPMVPLPPVPLPEQPAVDVGHVQLEDARLMVCPIITDFFVGSEASVQEPPEIDCASASAVAEFHDGPEPEFTVQLDQQFADAWGDSAPALAIIPSPEVEDGGDSWIASFWGRQNDDPQARPITAHLRFTASGPGASTHEDPAARRSLTQGMPTAQNASMASRSAAQRRTPTTALQSSQSRRRRRRPMLLRSSSCPRPARSQPRSPTPLCSCYRSCWSPPWGGRGVPSPANSEARHVDRLGSRQAT